MRQLQEIQQRIYEVRSQKVMLDSDLAELYETETKRLKEAVKHNIERLPQDFMFELTRQEFETLVTQIATSKRGGTRYMPFAITKHAEISFGKRQTASPTEQQNKNLILTN